MADDLLIHRDVAAREIPSGQPLILKAGVRVVVTQSYGSSYTVMTERGALLRIEGRDADALGLEVEAAPNSASPRPQGEGAVPRSRVEVEDAVWDLLRTVYDPELPVSVVELGLIYGCEVEVLPSGAMRVSVTMTMTAPGCGMGDVMRDEIEEKLSAIPEVESAHVELVLEPPWDPSMMTEAARLETGFY